MGAGLPAMQVQKRVLRRSPPGNRAARERTQDGHRFRADEQDLDRLGLGGRLRAPLEGASRKSWLDTGASGGKGWAIPAGHRCSGTRDARANMGNRPALGAGAWRRRGRVQGEPAGKDRGRGSNLRKREMRMRQDAPPAEFTCYHSNLWLAKNLLG